LDGIKQKYIFNFNILSARRHTVIKYFKYFVVPKFAMLKIAKRSANILKNFENIFMYI